MTRLLLALIFALLPLSAQAAHGHHHHWKHHHKTYNRGGNAVHHRDHNRHFAVSRRQSDIVPHASVAHLPAGAVALFKEYQAWREAEALKLAFGEESGASLYGYFKVWLARNGDAYAAAGGKP